MLYFTSVSKGSFLFLLAVVGAALSCDGRLSAAEATADRFQSNSPPIVKLTDRALRIHRRAPIIDGHNDLPWKLRLQADSSFDRIDLSQSVPTLQTDIPRLRAGGVGAQFWSAFVPSDTVRTGDALRKTLEQIDLIHRMVQRYPETFEMAQTAADVERIRRRNKIACLIGVEGGHCIENSLGVLRMFHSLGVRYMTLTHADTIDWADSATDEPKSHGLSDFGKDVVREMNRLGMLVDISHVSADTMRDVLATSRAPIIASHSSAYAIAPHPRNVPDDVLVRIKQNGGVVMVNFFSGFVVPESARVMSGLFAVQRQLRKEHPVEADYRKALDGWRKSNPIPAGHVRDLVDHIEHIVKVAGVDHVGLGSDYDGVTRLPAQLEDVSGYPYITQELLNRGYGEKEIKKVLGGNVLRALREAEKVARRSKRKAR